MKNRNKHFWLGILAITLVFAMTAVGCDNDTTDNGTTQTVKYESTDANGYTYILTITKNTSKAAYTPVPGDTYVLTIKKEGQPDMVSRGTVSANTDGALTLKPSIDGADSFSVTISDEQMTSITGTIAVEDGEPATAPGPVTPQGNNNNNNNNNNGGNGKPDATFDSIDAFATWLEAQPENTPDTAYISKLNVSDLGGNVLNSGSVGATLIANNTKYVNLDLSGSTFTSMPASNNYGAFERCTSLTSVTIGNSVTSIGESAFYQCINLRSVTFATGSNIPDANFGTTAFPEGGTLKTAYSTGKAGTYTRPSGGSTWMKQ